jgi:hypothetical protein
MALLLMRDGYYPVISLDQVKVTKGEDITGHHGLNASTSMLDTSFVRIQGDSQVRHFHAGRRAYSDVADRRYNRSTRKLVQSLPSD